jgi:DNA-binding CsgD family transcriptional regulator
LLTSREREVLQHAAFGLSNRHIGQRLGIAEQTVKNHLASAMRKLALHDRTHAVVVAIGRGLIGLPTAGPGHSLELDVAGHASAIDESEDPEPAGTGESRRALTD